MIKLIELVPSSIRNDPQVQAACEAIDQEIAEIYEDIPPVGFWANLDKATSPLLDVLMWEYHVDWTQNLLNGVPLTDQEKREAIDKSIVWHQKKGTKWAVEQILKVSFPTAIISEWYQYGGRPYFFRIMVDEDIGSHPDMLARTLDAVMATKNVRSWLESINRPRQTFGIVRVGAHQMRRKRLRIPSYDLVPPKRINLTMLVPEIFPSDVSSDATNLSPLEVLGDGFSEKSEILFDGRPIPTIFIDANRLQAKAPFDVGLPGPKLVVVRDGKDYSNVLTFTVRDPNSPFIERLDPDEAEEYTTITIHIYGRNFTPNSQVFFGGIKVGEGRLSSGLWFSGHGDPTTIPGEKSYDHYLDVDTGNIWMFPDGPAEEVVYYDSTHMSITINVGPASDKPIQIRIQNGEEYLSNVVMFRVTPATTLELFMIDPDRVTMENTLIDIDCYGVGFTPTSEILIDGVSIPTEYVSPNHIRSL